MWVGVQLRARLSTIICIQGFEFIFGEKCPVSGNEVEMKDKSFDLLMLLLSFFSIHYFAHFLLSFFSRKIVFVDVATGDASKPRCCE